MGGSLAKVGSILTSAGLALGDVVRVMSYVRDAVDGPQYNEIYREFFTAPLPSRSTISNCLSPALKFEVDVIAVRPVLAG